MKKLNCKGIDSEIKFVKEEIHVLIINLLRKKDELSKLEQIKTEMLCPEDRSPKAMKRNKELAEEIQRELNQ